MARKKKKKPIFATKNVKNKYVQKEDIIINWDLNETH